MSTSPTFPSLSSDLIFNPMRDISDSFSEISILDFAFASVFFALAFVFLFAAGFAGAVFASEGAVAAVCYVCGCGCGGVDWGCEGEGAGDVSGGL